MDLHINNVTLELDSKRVVDSFYNSPIDEYELGAIIRECKNSLALFHKLTG